MRISIGFTTGFENIYGWISKFKKLWLNKAQYLHKQTEEVQTPVISHVISPVISNVISHGIQKIEEADTFVISPVISNSPPKTWTTRVWDTRKINNKSVIVSSYWGIVVIC